MHNGNGTMIPGIDSSGARVSVDDVLNGIGHALQMVQGLGYVIIVGAKGDTGNLRCRPNVSRAEARAMLRSALDALGDGRIVLPE